MRTRWRLATLATVVCLCGALLMGAEKPPAEHVSAMKSLATFLQTMTRPGAEQDFDEAKRWVPIVRDALAVAGNYWNDRNAAGLYNAEVTNAQEGIKEASDMGVSANLSSAEGIAASVKAIATRCQPCHEKRREQAPDGTFLISAARP